jgi:hypothetical protein
VPPLPPPLPPAERTVGQVIAESLRLYGRRFWASLGLGVPPALFTLGLDVLEDGTRVVFGFVAGPPLLAASLVGAVLLAGEPRRGSVVAAFVAALPAFVVFAAARLFLFAGSYLLAVLWFALLGLAASAVLVEGRGVPGAWRRSLRLARADLVHAVGTVAALAVIIGICLFLLFFLLTGFGEQGGRAAALIAVLVAGPLFFLGTALLYFDQEARDNARRVPRR